MIPSYLIVVLRDMLFSQSVVRGSDRKEELLDNTARKDGEPD